MGSVDFPPDLAIFWFDVLNFGLLRKGDTVAALNAVLFRSHEIGRNLMCQVLRRKICRHIRWVRFYRRRLFFDDDHERITGQVIDTRGNTRRPRPAANDFTSTVDRRNGRIVAVPPDSSGKPFFAAIAVARHQPDRRTLADF